jgi:hypothetical protein
MSDSSISHNPHETQGVVPMKDFRAATLAAAGAVQPTGRGRFAVTSSSGERAYSVVRVRGAYLCNCPATKSKQEPECKHALACRAWVAAVALVARAREEGRGEQVEGAALTMSLQADAGVIDHFRGLTAEIVLLAARYLDSQGAKAVAA